MAYHIFYTSAAVVSHSRLPGYEEKTAHQNFRRISKGSIIYLKGQYFRLQSFFMKFGQFKHRYWYLSRYLKIFIKTFRFLASSQYRGGCTIALFQLNVWCEKCVAFRHYTVICKQLLISNDRNRVRWVVLGLSEDGACTDFWKSQRE